MEKVKKAPDTAKQRLVNYLAETNRQLKVYCTSWTIKGKSLKDYADMFVKKVR